MKNHRKLATLILLLALIGPSFDEVYHFTIVSVGETTPNLSLIGETADWQPQDYPGNPENTGSQGINSVHLEGGKLNLTAHLVGNDSNFEKGEVWLDLRYFPGLEGQVPIDLSQKNITVEAEVPDDFVGLPNKPNGLQVFVKENDTSWTPQYGPWVNIDHGGKFEAKLTPTTTSSFDSKNIIIIGVKFAIGDGSLDTYNGPLYITNVTVQPPFELTPPPPLPQSTPQPTFTDGDSITVKSDGFYLNNNKWFVVGGNFRGLPYGQNFGVTDWFVWGNGVSRHPNFFKINFDYFRRSGIKVVRVELLADGRTMFDKEGHVTGYNRMFREDVKTFLNLADEAGLKVEFTLLDFLIAGQSKNVDGVWLRGRSGIFTNETLKKEFMNDFLNLFLKEFGGNPALMGFDILNEPEWIVTQKDGGDWEDADNTTKAESPVPIEPLKGFINDCIAAIRIYAPGKLTTVGVSINFTELVKELNLDYFAFHYYQSMGDLSYYFPLPTGKPWILEEYPTHNTTLSITEYLNFTLAAGGAGALLWNLSPEIDDFAFTYYERDAKFLELNNWVNLAAPPTPTPTPTQTPPTPTPTQTPPTPTPTQTPPTPTPTQTPPTPTPTQTPPTPTPTQTPPTPTPTQTPPTPTPTQTPPTPTPTQTPPTPTPIVPELSWLVILPLFVSMVLIAVKLRHRKTITLSKDFVKIKLEI